MATLIGRPVTQFHGIDGREHRIGYLPARNNASKLLVDDYEGHGFRMLALLNKERGDSEAQAEAVIREYRVDAAVAKRPLSRRVVPAEIADSSRLVTA